MLETPAAGRARLVWLAEGVPGETWEPGACYEKNSRFAAWKVNTQAKDPDLARILWERSAQLTAGR